MLSSPSGVSYGTVLGSTFASLFPTRLGKFVLDGVVDVPEYYTGTWSSNLHNADLAVEDFFRFCHAAGPTKCALWSNSTAAISQRTRGILEAVRTSPVPVYDGNVVRHPQLIRYEELVFLFLAMMYSPLSNWPKLAQLLSDLEKRDGVSTAALLGQASPTMLGVTPLIGGLDSVRKNRGNFDTYEKWTAHHAEMGEESEWVADAWASLGLVTKDLEMYPPASQQFNGEFGNTYFCPSCGGFGEQAANSGL